MPRHAMIDMEMLGLQPTSVVIQIAGLKFNPKGQSPRFVQEFSHKMNLEAQEEAGRTLDESTLEWWHGQKRERPLLYRRVFPPPHKGMLIDDMLRRLREWCRGCEAFWSFGMLDFPILNDMLASHSISRPWKPAQCFDCRTVIARFERDPRLERKYQKHNPLEKCRVQAESVQTAYRKFGFER